jgi:hypothetical protein
MPDLQLCTDAIFILDGKSIEHVARDSQSSSFIRDSQICIQIMCYLSSHIKYFFFVVLKASGYGDM